MAVVEELLRSEANGTISFGNHDLAAKKKVEDFEHRGDLYKVKTFAEITKLEKNGMFLYESVPGTTVHEFDETAKGVTFLAEGAHSTQITVGLKEDTEYLDEVVVIGYGTVKKDDMTGSISAIKAEDLNRGAVVNTQDMLKGKISGVLVVPGDGGPGSGSRIRIRGAASLNASNDPLIVIDGVPVAQGAGGSMSNPLDLLNPNDIESFSILAGYLEGKVVDANTVKALADIPTKEVLIATVIGSIQAPLYSLAYTLQCVVDKASEEAPAEA